MTLNWVIPISLCLEFSILIWEIVILEYGKSPSSKSLWFRDNFRVLEQIFFGIIIFTLLTSLYWAWYFWRSDRKINTYVRIFRFAEGIILLVMSGLLIFNGFLILHPELLKESGVKRESYDSELVLMGFVFKVFAVIDACLHFKSHCKTSDKPEAPKITMIVDQTNKTTKIDVGEGFEAFPSFPTNIYPSYDYTLKF